MALDMNNEIAMDYSILEICPSTPSSAKSEEFHANSSSSFQKFLNDLSQTGQTSMDLTRSRELFELSSDELDRGEKSLMIDRVMKPHW